MVSTSEFERTANQFGLRWYFVVVRQYRKTYANILLASIFIQLSALGAPLAIQVLFDKVIIHSSLSSLALVMGMLIVIGSFEVTLQYLRSYALSYVACGIDMELGRRLFAHLLRLPIDYFERVPAGQIAARLRELDTIRVFLLGQGITACVDAVFALVFFIVLFFYSASLTLIVLASVCLHFIALSVLRPVVKRRSNQTFLNRAANEQFTLESIVGMSTIKAGVAEPLIQVQWNEKLGASLNMVFSTRVLISVLECIAQSISKLSFIAILYFGARAAMRGDITMGELLAFNMIAALVEGPVVRLTALWQDFQQVRVSIERIGEILRTKPERRPDTPRELPPVCGAVSLQRVMFHYCPTACPVLQDISLDIPAGQIIGIIGPSGSGKSTLTKLVQRLYSPQAGNILIDGIDIAHVDPAWIRQFIGVVLQENVLFNRTVHDNIAFNNPAMTRDEVRAAARLASAESFVLTLPDGYDTQIVERGANLSHGQRQRLAIARALAGSPRILILDEATSAVDYETEIAIQNNLAEIAAGRTVIIVAHRLASVRNCHRIIAVEGGRIVQDGSHESLLQLKEGFYQRLWNLQGHSPSC